MIFKDKEYRSLYFKTVTPIMMQSILTAIIAATDTIMVGVLSSDSLAAVSLANQITMIVNSLVTAAGVGISALAAQYYGKNDMESVHKVMYTGLRFAFGLGSVFFVPTLICPQIIMGVLTNEPTLIAMGAGYLRAISLAYLIMPFSQSWMTILRNSGKSTTVMAISLISGALNFVFDAILIFGLFGFPAMGIVGAALSTTFVQIAALASLLIINIRVRRADSHDISSGVHLEFPKLFVAYRALRRKFIHYAFPPIVQNGAWILAGTAIAAIIGHLGKDAVAANAMAILVYNLCTSVFGGTAVGSGTLLGMQLGDNQIDAAKKHAIVHLKMNVLVGCIVCAIVLILRSTIVSLNSNFSAQSIAYLEIMLVAIAFKSIFGALCGEISMGILSVGGDIRYLTILDIVNMWCIIVPIGYLLAFVLHLPVIAVFIWVNLDETTKIYFMISRVYSWKWAKNLTKVEWAEPGRYDRMMKDRLINKMPTGLMILGSYGHIKYINDAASNILKIDPVKAQGSNMLRFFIENGDNDEFANLILDSMYDANEIYSSFIKYNAGGSTKDLRVHTVLLEEEDLRLGLCAVIDEVVPRPN